MPANTTFNLETDARSARQKVSRASLPPAVLDGTGDMPRVEQTAVELRSHSKDGIRVARYEEGGRK